MVYAKYGLGVGESVGSAVAVCVAVGMGVSVGDGVDVSVGVIVASGAPGAQAVNVAIMIVSSKCFILNSDQVSWRKISFVEIDHAFQEFSFDILTEYVPFTFMVNAIDDFSSGTEQ